MSKITIAGREFQVDPRYAEGHVLNVNEASALNQTFFENLRNNFAGKMKDGAIPEAELDSKFAEYAASYAFGVRTGGGGGSRDPVEVEAMNLARDAIKKGIQNLFASGKSTKKVGDYSAKAISEAAAKLIEQNPVYREKAKERVAQMQEVAGESVDSSILDSLTANAEPTEEVTGAEESTAEASVESTETSTEGEAQASGKRRRG